MGFWKIDSSTKAKKISTFSPKKHIGLLLNLLKSWVSKWRSPLNDASFLAHGFLCFGILVTREIWGLEDDWFPNQVDNRNHGNSTRRIQHFRDNNDHDGYQLLTSWDDPPSTWPDRKHPKDAFLKEVKVPILAPWQFQKVAKRRGKSPGKGEQSKNPGSLG